MSAPRQCEGNTANKCSGYGNTATVFTLFIDLLVYKHYLHTTLIPADTGGTYLQTLGLQYTESVDVLLTLGA